MTKTIRLERASDATLKGYIFDDFQHARRWLTQRFVKPAEYRLQEVDAGPIMRCRSCDGTGIARRHVKVLRKLTVEEFIQGRQADGS